jgi:hypothetical protein
MIQVPQITKKKRNVPFFPWPQQPAGGSGSQGQRAARIGYYRPTMTKNTRAMPNMVAKSENATT